MSRVSPSSGYACTNLSLDLLLETWANGDAQLEIAMDGVHVGGARRVGGTWHVEEIACLGGMDAARCARLGAAFIRMGEYMTTGR